MAGKLSRRENYTLFS